MKLSRPGIVIDRLLRSWRSKNIGCDDLIMSQPIVVLEADPLRPKRAYHILRLNRGQAVRFTIGFFLFLAATAWVPIGFGQAQPTDDSLLLCAVNLRA